MISYVVKNVLERKIRTGLCVLGVTVSVALIVALFSLVQGMRESLDTYMQASGASLVVFDADAAELDYSRIEARDIEKIEEIQGVDGVARANFAMIMAPQVRSTPRRAGFMLVFGRLPEERLMTKYAEHLLEGRVMRGPSEILVGEYTAAQMEIRLGDRLDLFNREILGIEEYEVVGIYRTDINWENLGIVVHASVVQKYLNSGDSYSALFVYTDRLDDLREEERTLKRVQDQIEAEFPHLIAKPSGEFMERFSEPLGFIDEFLAMMTVIALVVGTLGVLNTMMMSISERTREIGTLRALGWSRTRVLALVVNEGLLIAVAGGVLGLFAGTAGTQLLMWWFPSGLLHPTYSPDIYLTGGLVALLVGAVGAFYPALRAASLRPVEALRYE